jgi:hypothetical protein
VRKQNTWYRVTLEDDVRYEYATTIPSRDDTEHRYWNGWIYDEDTNDLVFDRFRSLYIQYDFEEEKTPKLSKKQKRQMIRNLYEIRI